MAICPNGHHSVADDFCDACGARIAAGRSPGASRVVGRHHAGGPRPAQASDDTCPWCGAQTSGPFCERCGFQVRRPSGLSEPQPVAWAAAGPVSPAASPGPPESLFPPVSRPEREPAPEPAPAEPAPGAPPLGEAAPDQHVPLNGSAAPDGPDSYSWSEPPRPPSFPPVTWTVVVTPDRAHYDRMQVKEASLRPPLTFPDYTSEWRYPLAGKQMRIGRRSAERGLQPEIDLSGPPADPGVSRLHALLIPGPDGTWAVLDPGSANGTLLNGQEVPVGELIPLRDGDRINLGAWTAITVHREKGAPDGGLPG